MKKVLIISLMIILFLVATFPVLSLEGYENKGIPIELIVSDKANSNIITDLTIGILNSSDYCLFVGQAYRIRIIVTVDYINTKDVFNYTYLVEWYARLDQKSRKFLYLDTIEGTFNHYDSQLLTAAILEHTDELIFEE